MLKKIGKIALKIVVGFFVISILWVFLYKWVNPPFTFLMASKKINSWLPNEEPIKIYYEWKNIENISRYMPLAVIASEDQLFLTHNGFDIEAINTAMKYNKTHDKKKGASTISQQVAKNVFLWPTRNFIRKGFEAYFTVLIELIWGKKRIMEMYLNVIELNNNRFGVEQGALYAFNTKSKNLNKAQCARIAAILPLPRKFNAKNPGPYIMRRQSQIVYQMNCVGIDLSQWYQ